MTFLRGWLISREPSMWSSNSEVFLLFIFKPSFHIQTSLSMLDEFVPSYDPKCKVLYKRPHGHYWDSIHTKKIKLLFLGSAKFCWNLLTFKSSLRKPAHNQTVKWSRTQKLLRRGNAGLFFTCQAEKDDQLTALTCGNVCCPYSDMFASH